MASDHTSPDSSSANVRRAASRYSGFGSSAIVVEEALRAGGSMVHHHGIGKYRTPWVREEHGSAYVLLERLKQAFDPNGVMNAGTIFPLDGFTDPYVGIPGREAP